MSVIVKLTKEQMELFSSASITHSGGNTYRFLPYAFKSGINENEFEIVMLKDLPQNVREYFLKTDEHIDLCPACQSSNIEKFSNYKECRECGKPW